MDQAVGEFFDFMNFIRDSPTKLRGFGHVTLKDGSNGLGFVHIRHNHEEPKKTHVRKAYWAKDKSPISPREVLTVAYDIYKQSEGVARESLVRLAYKVAAGTIPLLLRRNGRQSTWRRVSPLLAPVRDVLLNGKVPKKAPTSNPSVRTMKNSREIRELVDGDLSVRKHAVRLRIDPTVIQVDLSVLSEFFAVVQFDNSMGAASFDQRLQQDLVSLRSLDPKTLQGSVKIRDRQRIVVDLQYANIGAPE